MINQRNIKFSLNPGILKGLVGLSQSPHPYSKRIVEQFLRAQEIHGVLGEEDIISLIQGEIRVGFVDSPGIASPESNLIFGIRPEDAPKNILFFGQSGTGKTNALLNVMTDLIKLDQFNTVFALDFKGELFRYSYNYSKEVLNNDEMLYLDGKRNFFINPLEPPDIRISFDIWASIVSDAMAYALGIRDESRSALLSGIKKAYRDIPKGSYPSLIDVYPKLLELRPRSYDQRVKSDYYARAEYRVLMILQELMNTIGCRKGVPFEQLINRRLIVINLSDCNTLAKKFISIILLVKIYKYCKLIDFEPKDIRYVFVCDEGGQLFRTQSIAYKGYL